MNKYWASIICTFIVCATVISYFHFIKSDKYLYEKIGSNTLIRIDRTTGDTYQYSVGVGWIHVSREVW